MALGEDRRCDESLPKRLGLDPGCRCCSKAPVPRGSGADCRCGLWPGLGPVECAKPLVRRGPHSFLLVYPTAGLPGAGADEDK